MKTPLESLEEVVSKQKKKKLVEAGTWTKYMHFVLLVEDVSEEENAQARKRMPMIGVGDVATKCSCDA